MLMVRVRKVMRELINRPVISMAVSAKALIEVGVMKRPHSSALCVSKNLHSRISNEVPSILRWKQPAKICLHVRK